MAWHKRAAKKGPTAWQQETCVTTELTARLEYLANARWLVKYVFWDGLQPGIMTIVSMQSAEYAPKVKAPKKAKATE